ncbi:MAG: hypothetical protein J2P13_04665 [Acidobacteria bacterium]|nr:hypothetical protein [Acidobacteriota bacterium]
MTDSKARIDCQLEERFLRYARARQSAAIEDETAGNKPRLQMKWIIVTENGKRQLRMQWSVPETSGAARQAFQTNAGNRVSKRREASRELGTFERMRELSKASGQ